MLKIQPLPIQVSQSNKSNNCRIVFSRKGLWLIGEEGWKAGTGGTILGLEQFWVSYLGPELGLGI